MSSPCHVEMVLCQKDEGVKKEQEAEAPKLTKKQRARARLVSGASSAAHPSD